MKDSWVPSRLCASVLFLAVLSLSVPCAAGGHDYQYRSVRGLDIYLTVIPAEMIRGYEKDRLEGKLDGSIPSLNYYRIIVVLFDRATQQRIISASVAVKVENEKYKGRGLSLDPVLFQGKLGYGNFFQVPVDSWFYVSLDIEREGESIPITTRFAWARI